MVSIQIVRKPVCIIQMRLNAFNLPLVDNSVDSVVAIQNFLSDYNKSRTT